VTRVRVGSLQYNLRPVGSFQEFADQVSALVGTASDYGCRLVVFPEYFTVQLLHLADIHRPIDLQVRDLARQVDAYRDLMSELAREHGLYIVGGSIPVLDDVAEDIVYNVCYVFGPSGGHVEQGKIHVTRWEREEWRITPARRLRLIDTDFGRMVVTICYDAEFPELSRAAAREGALLQVVPSCTDDRQGFLRVRYCAHARAIENQLYVVHACTVGSLPQVPAVSLNYGAASILTPSDFAFSNDGILRAGIENHEMMVIGDLDLAILEETRSSGSVLPLTDSQTTAEVTKVLETVEL
jgi:predicted amidohydrolase